MIKTWLRNGGRVAWVAVLALGLAQSADAGTVPVYANDQSTGDMWTGSFFNPTEPIGASGWRYVDATTGLGGFGANGGAVGINGNLPHDGNGSVYFSGASSNSKAGIAFRPGGVIGLLSELTTLSYDYIRTGGGAAAHFAPAIKLEVTANGKSGSLVWEPVYNGYSTNDPIDLDTWYHGNAIGGTFWATNALFANGVNTFKSLDDWVATLGPASKITGIYVGIGSGWGGSFSGAADNIAFGFNGDSTTYNFNLSPAAVPEPGSIAMGLIAGGLGLGAAAWRRRRVA